VTSGFQYSVVRLSGSPVSQEMGFVKANVLA